MLRSIGRPERAFTPLGLWLLALWCGAAQAEPTAAEAPDVGTPEEPPALQLEPGAPDRPLRWFRYPLAIVEGAAFNLSYNLTVRYVAQEEWARISVDSIRQNGEAGWVWDEDLFSTNQFSHPYHGTILHHLGRVHGLTYWESLPVVALGSWEWERFLETDAPSINDQVTTTLAGAFMGEILWKLSGRILDGSSTGRLRLARELGGAVVAAPRGLDRLVTGKAWRQAGGTVRVSMQQRIGAGYRISAQHTSQLRLHYAVRYGKLQLNTPLDAFEASLDGLVGTNLHDTGIELFVEGGLVGDQIAPHHLVGIFQRYDYVTGPTLRMGSTAVGPAWWADVPVSGPWELSVRASTMVVPLAAIDSPYAQQYTERSYIFGPGGLLGLKLNLANPSVGSIFAEGRVFSAASPTPPRGHEVVGRVAAGATAQFIEHFGLEIQATATTQRGVYAEHDSHKQSTLTLQLMGISSF